MQKNWRVPTKPPGIVDGTKEEEGVPGERNEGAERVEEGGRRDGEETWGIEGGFIGERVDLGNDFEENVDDENPAEGDDEGETPVETEEMHPDKGKSPVTAEVEEPENGGLKDIVDLVDEPESEDTPVKERVARRMTRRSMMLDEVDEPTRSRKLQFGAQGAGVKAGRLSPNLRRILLRQKRGA